MKVLDRTPRRVSLPLSPNQRALARTGRPHISYSEIRTYQACPLKWHYQYVERAKPEQISAAMLLGTCTHAMIQRVLEAQIGSDPLPTIDELMDIYRNAWAIEAADVLIQYAKDQDAETRKTTARRMIEAFLATDLACPAGVIVGIEENSTVELARDLPDLAGRVDLITYAEGVLTVTDFKTARATPTDEAADEAGEQLILYAQGCQPIANELGATIRLRFIYISKTKEPKVEAIEVTLDNSRTHRSKAIIRQVFKAILSGIVYPAPSPMNCTGCPFKQRCRRWHQHNGCALTRALTRDGHCGSR